MSMNKTVFSTIMVFILILGIPLVFAQKSGQADTGTGTVGPGVQTRFLGPADQKFIDAAEEYVKQKLGEEYYNQFISFQSGDSYEDCIENECTVRNEISFNYKIPFETVSDPHLGGPPRIGVRADNDENIVKYVGPIKAYQFLISKEEAIEKAKSYGLVNVTNAGIVTSSGGEDGYEIVWAVSSNDLAGYGEVLKEPLYKGVYVDVDSGDIRGEYRINPLIKTPSGTGGVNLGEFFEEQEIQKEQDAQRPINIGILALIIIVVLIAVFFIWYRFYRK